MTLACPHDGCGVVLDDDAQMAQHAASCGHRVVACTNASCDERVAWTQLAAHVARCAFSPAACERCAEMVTPSSRDTHRATCRLAPQACRWDGCGRVDVPRCELAAHERSCAHRHASCAFADAGCPHSGTAAELKQHSATFVAEHLELLLARVNQQQQQLLQQQQQQPTSSSSPPMSRRGPCKRGGGGGGGGKRCFGVLLAVVLFVVARCLVPLALVNTLKVPALVLAIAYMAFATLRLVVREVAASEAGKAASALVASKLNAMRERCAEARASAQQRRVLNEIERARTQEQLNELKCRVAKSQ